MAAWLPPFAETLWPRDPNTLPLSVSFENPLTYKVIFGYDLAGEFDLDVNDFQFYARDYFVPINAVRVYQGALIVSLIDPAPLAEVMHYSGLGPVLKAKVPGGITAKIEKFQQDF